MIESVIIGILRIANTSRKIHVKWERVVGSSTHKRRIDLSVVNENSKNKGKESEKEKVTFASVNIAHHGPRTTPGTLLQIETSKNAHLKAKGMF